jgi:hypothetical protein
MMYSASSSASRAAHAATCPVLAYQKYPIKIQTAKIEAVSNVTNR